MCPPFPFRNLQKNAHQTNMFSPEPDLDMAEELLRACLVLGSRCTFRVHCAIEFDGSTDPGRDLAFLR